jgi:hypothetical protein
MKATVRLFGLLITFLGLTLPVFAQDTPPNDGEVPGDGTPPDVEVPTNPPALPPGMTVLIERIDGSPKATVIYTLSAPQTGALATSPDLENWTLVNVPAPESGSIVKRLSEVPVEGNLFIRWVTSEP